MREKPKSESHFIENRLSPALAWSFALVSTVTTLAVVLYYSNFGGRSLSEDPEQWGQFGDFLGGVINPVVGLVTVFLVIVSISVQRKELAATVEEMKSANEGAARMSFEQSLFAWLASYQNLLESIVDRDRSGRKLLKWWSSAFSGPVTFNNFRSDGTSIYINSYASLEALVASAATEPVARNQVGVVFERALNGFINRYNHQRSDLDALLRTLYRLIRWIDSSAWSAKDKWHYVALVRAQLSSIEMAYLLYNSLTARGEKFAVLINKYALLDNLAYEDDLLVDEIVNVYSQAKTSAPPPFGSAKPWPLRPSAFSSDIAKQQLALPIDT